MEDAFGVRAAGVTLNVAGHAATDAEDAGFAYGAFTNINAGMGKAR